MDDSESPLQARLRWRVYAKNVRGLKTEKRVYELLEELEGTEWDAILLSETWRPEGEEIWTTAGGHLFMGSGFSEERRGVGILLHARWNHKRHFQNFIAINERVCYADVSCGKAVLRLVSVYMPDSTYSDKQVELIYTILSGVLVDARSGAKLVAIGGDFNAEVGSDPSAAQRATIGRHGLNTRNARGEWLQSWASTEELILANTHFKKRGGRKVTHIGTTGRKRQIDYILLVKTLWRRAVDAGTVASLDLGSDHKTIQATFDTDGKRPRVFTHDASRLTKGWEPRNLPEYEAAVEERLKDYELFIDDVKDELKKVEEQCNRIELAMVQAGEGCRHAEQYIENECNIQKDKLNELLQQRRRLRAEGGAREVAAMEA